MRKIRIVAAVVMLAALRLTAAARRRTTPLASKSEAKTYAVSKAYTTLSFTARKWMVFKEAGLFQDFSGTLTYSSQDPAKCKIEVTVQAASLDTRNSTRDKVLRSDDFFSPTSTVFRVGSFVFYDLGFFSSLPALTCHDLR